MNARRVIVTTHYWAKPIPIRGCDWEAMLDSYEPGDPIGHGQTEADAVHDLFIEIASREEDDQERYDYETGARP